MGTCVTSAPRAALLPTAIVVIAGLFVPVVARGDAPAWELANPLKPLPDPPLGIEGKLSELEDPPTPDRVRLGRWLFFDKRLSADGSVACSSCHKPENAFSESTPVSTGIRGQKGGRKAPSFVNMAWTIYPNFFWDGRASSLEEQALGPIANPIEMGNTHDAMITTLRKVAAYGKYFQEAFGSPEITKERVAKAIADYERTRFSGNSTWDRWKAKSEEVAAAGPAGPAEPAKGGKAKAKVGCGKGCDEDLLALGDQLFFGKAGCNQCHLGQNFTDSLFHNLGVGWDPKKKAFKDEGRSVISKKEEDKGAFKTPTVREVSKHPPYMHDGSQKTLEAVIDHYDKGGTPNPTLDGKIKPLHLTPKEKRALVYFMLSLDGEGYQDVPPAVFPQ